MMNAQYMNGQPQPNYGPPPGTGYGPPDANYGPPAGIGYAPQTAGDYGPPSSAGYVPSAGIAPGSYSGGGFPPLSVGQNVGPGSQRYPPPPGPGGFTGQSGAVPPMQRPPGTSFAVSGQPLKPGPPNGSGAGMFAPPPHTSVNQQGGSPPNQNIRGPPPPQSQAWGQQYQPTNDTMASSSSQLTNQMNGMSISSAPTNQWQGAPPMNQSGPPPPRPGYPVGGVGPSHGPPATGLGQTPVNQAQPMMNQGPPKMGQVPPPMSSQGPSMGAQQGPPTLSQGPPTMGQGPPAMGQGPPMGMRPGAAGMPLTRPGAAPPGQVYQPSGPPGLFPGPPATTGFTSGPPGMGAPPRPGPPPVGGMQAGALPGGGGPPPMGMNQPGTVPPGPPFNPGPQTTMNFGSNSPVPSSNYQQGGAAYPGGSYQGGVRPQGGVGPQGMPPGNYSAQGGGQGMKPMGPAGGPGGAAAGPSSFQPQSQPRRLDPDQMPSPIQVMEDDRRNRGGLFQTGQKGSVPPLVTTNFIAEDQGTCSPRFMRSTMYNVPCTSDLLKQAHVPFIVTIVPFARLHPKEVSPPIVDLGNMGPVRCNRCKAYICPYMQFTDGGRKFQCNFCSCNTEVPAEYFAHLDHTGRRIDCYDRPELCLGAYEFVATTDYCKDNKLPNAPAFIFMIDVSYNSVKSGLVDLLCARLKDEVLRCLPKDVGDEESEIRVAFVTYAKELHFYNIKGTLSQPQMLVVSDVDDMFVPLLDGFFVKVSEAEVIIDSLLTQISQVFSEARETEIVLGPVIQAGLDALRSAERAGKLIIFHSSLPTAEAPGKLLNRDDRKLLGTDKEKTLLTAQTNFYTKLSSECVAAGCSVDLFLFPNSYIDVATVSEVSRLTGGSVYKYPYFQSDLDGDLLMSDLVTNVSRPIAFDAVVRVRTSTGIRAVDFFGNFYMSNTTDVELASVDCEKSITVEIRHDDKLSEAEGAYVQAAILYTSVGGRRRLRVLNTSFNCCTQVADMFRNCELDMLINYMAKISIRESLNSNSKQVRDNLMNQCAQILACYRKNCASPSSSGQLILPECMKLLPVYVNCVIKSSILQSVDISTDDRSYAMHLVNSMSVADSSVFFYPRLLPLHEVDVNATALPTAIRCSYERLRDNGVYLLENGLTMFMWIGLGADPEWIRNVFNVASTAQIDIDKTRLVDLDNPLSKRIKQIVRRIREERHRHMKLIIIRQRDKLEPVFMQYLVEDRGSSGSSSYVDFLCHIHKEIRNLLN